MASESPVFDAIVVGSGITGGWAAKELTEQGLKVLVLERGPKLDPSDYTDMIDPWDHPDMNMIPQAEIATKYPFHSAVAYAMFNSNKSFWADESQHPYESTAAERFRWIRGYHVGGRSLMWGRASYRWSDDDFEANKRDGHGTDWPVRYADLAPWYAKVETFVGIAGDRDNLPNLPDGNFLKGFELNTAEKYAKTKIEAAFPGRNLIIGRVANLSEPTEAHLEQGRGKCQARSLCSRGCSFGAYFSSVSATLPAATRTGLLTLKTNAIVHSVTTDAAGKRATGVRVIDSETRKATSYTARIVFLCASTIGSAAILLNSRSAAHSRGLANASDQLGRNLMDHVIGGNVSGTLPGMLDWYDKGRRPIPAYMPRYGNFTEKDKPYLRGFGYQLGANRSNWDPGRPGVGAALKTANRTPGPWVLGFLPFAEMLPNPANRVTLSQTKTDRWGIPIPVIDCSFGANERLLIAEATKDSQAMLQAAGATGITPANRAIAQTRIPGEAIHEMGTVRMGRDPDTSVLNGWNQAHDIPNLFVTDGAAMASTATQNPSLTYMAFTVRAAHYAATRLREGTL